MPLVTPGPAVSAATPGAPGGLGVALGGPDGRLLVADVDDLDALLLAAVVDREQVAAREREEVIDAPRAQGARHEAAAVDGGLLAGRRRRGHEP